MLETVSLDRHHLVLHLALLTAHLGNQSISVQLIFFFFFFSTVNLIALHGSQAFHSKDEGQAIIDCTDSLLLGSQVT